MKIKVRCVSYKGEVSVIDERVEHYLESYLGRSEIDTVSNTSKFVGELVNKLMEKNLLSVEDLKDIIDYDNRIVGVAEEES